MRSTTIEEARKWVQEHARVDIEIVEASLRNPQPPSVLSLTLPEDLLTSFALSRFFCAQLEKTKFLFSIIEHSVFSEEQELALFEMAVSTVCPSFDIRRAPAIVCDPGDAFQLITVLALGFALQWDILVASADPRLVVLTSHDGFIDIPVWEEVMKNPLAAMGFREVSAKDGP